MIEFEIEFDFEAVGKTSDEPDDNPIISSGRMRFLKEVDEDKVNYINNGDLYSEALGEVMDNFYNFQFLDEGYIDISEVTITIRNLRVTEF